MINDESKGFNEDDSDENPSGKQNNGQDSDDKSTEGFDDEILDILRKAESISTNELEIPFPEYSTPESDEDIVIPSDVQDPERAHTLYHKKLQPLLKKYLKSKDAKELIREQVNLHLKEGHERGRDGKQAYYHSMERVISIIEEWVRKTQGKDLVSLYVTLVEKNKEAGYIK